MMSIMTKRNVWIKRAILSILVILSLAIPKVESWTGSDPEVSITFPADNTIPSAPFSVYGKCYNSTNGIDYYQIEYWADTNENNEADAGDTNSSWILLRKQEDYNFDYPSARLTKRYECDITKFEQSKYYLIRIWAMDLNGSTSSLTDVNYMLGTGDDNTWIDREVINFRISGYRP